MRTCALVGLLVLACGGSESSSGRSRPQGTGGGDGDASTSSSGGAQGTGGKSGCGAGTETCPCYGNGTCNAGLVCASNLCVNMNAGNGGANAGGNAASAGAGGLEAGGQGAGGQLPSAGGASSTGAVSSMGGAGATGGASSSGGVAAGGSSSTGGRIAMGGAGGSVQCAREGSICNGDPSICCLGTTCVYDVQSPGNSTCQRLCQSSTQCASGCCVLLTSGTVSVCAPPQYCPSICRTAGYSCTDDAASCCAGSTCVYDDASNTTSSCADDCFYDSDCRSNCCAPLTNGGAVCSNPIYCGGSCLPAGTRPCALGTPCCAGTYCISDAINQICLPLCSTDLDCATGCCAAPNGNGVYVCTEPAYCGR